MLGRGTFERVEPIWRQLIEGYGMQLTIEELIAEGPVVAARYRETGRIRRRWGARDAASQDRQLGIPLE